MLQVASDEREHSLKETAELLADRFHLSADERTQLLPSGATTYLKNRTGWARTYLKKAGLLEIPREGYFKITRAGRDFLRTAPDPINPRDLRVFEGFAAFAQGQPQKVAAPKPVAEDADELTPDEVIEKAYSEYVETLAEEIIDRTLRSSPEFFERLVVRLLVGMGYGGNLREAGMAVGRSGDEGIDGIIKEDPLGLDNIYIQAKRWQGGVGAPEIQKFVGALAQKKANKGVFITTSYFSSEARAVAQAVHNSIILIDGKRLASLMIQHSVGVTETNRYLLQRIDEGFFEVG